MHHPVPWETIAVILGNYRRKTAPAIVTAEEDQLYRRTPLESTPRSSARDPRAGSHITLFVHVSGSDLTAMARPVRSEQSPS